MNKLLLVFTLHLMTVFSVTAQQLQKKTNAYNGILLTRLTEVKTKQGNERDTCKILYLQNSSKDSLLVYKIAEGIISEATAYSLTGNGKGLNLNAKSVLNNSETADGWQITFSDAEHLMRVNQDHYVLYPKFYASVKQEINTKHSIIGLFDLLEDYLEDYSIRDIYPVLLSENRARWSKTIQKAKITTQRSQSDLKDTWDAKYVYNSLDKLKSIKAASAEETHFSKKMSYVNSGTIKMDIYRNTEDRQIISRQVIYSPLKINQLKITDQVEETGQNKETILITTINKKKIGKVKSLYLSPVEVKQLVKQFK
ncbi:hypothetical protein [Pedobacter zeae]|uniref:Uncharacterized protein n=1 Tax=Pedobacter zeae TaxID=1737356 RepID=A0A7W6KCI5_9SPHI|nr:hypothetical protein [Pedobacter zeae]MBB4109308.1 hypothetical protein [Pedobacter zeae]GGH19833.1 hypothetical protein GCM10007422_44950 [Pedobacter zeae]